MSDLSYPCRTCHHCDEKKFDIVLMAVNLDCKLNIVATSYTMYGSKNQVTGESICKKYKHVDGYW